LLLLLSHLVFAKLKLILVFLLTFDFPLYLQLLFHLLGLLDFIDLHLHRQLHVLVAIQVKLLQI
jgi:hypothetical protein